MNKSEGGRPVKNQSKATTSLDEPKTLSDMGVTKDQSSKWQKLAAVPDEEFEA